MSDADAIYRFVDEKISMLQTNDSWSRGMLAKLRRGIGKEPADVPDVWEITLNDMPAELLLSRQSGDQKASKAEYAIHTALTLFALHQQGNDQSVCTHEQSFASAVRRLISSSDEDCTERIRRRFSAVITSNDLTEMSHHMRGLIQLIKASDTPIQIDYPLFAEDLYFYQIPEYKSKVCLDWGEEFYGRSKKKDSDTNG